MMHSALNGNQYDATSVAFTALYPAHGPVFVRDLAEAARRLSEERKKLLAYRLHQDVALQQEIVSYYLERVLQAQSYLTRKR